MNKKQNKTGETRIMNNGMKAIIIEYRNCNDIDVQFDDGYISHNARYGHFKKGNIKNPNIPRNKERLGETRMMNCGMKATVIEYRKYNDIDIKFENGYIQRNQHYGNFKKGEIGNPTIFKNERLGETQIMNCNMKASIIEYRKYNDIDVQFDDGYIVYNTSYKHFKEGNIKNPFVKNIFNVGYIGNTKMVNKKIHMYWVGMLRRCYSDEYHKLEPTYIGCEICDEWKCYENFEKWYNENYYEVENERTEIDKDILIKGNKIYSPETCVFIPQRINKLFTKNQATRGDYPIGVCKQKNKYCASCSILNDSKVKKGKFLGYFDTPEKAFYAYKEFKEQYIKQVADEYKDKIPKKLYDAMYKWEVEIDD